MDIDEAANKAGFEYKARLAVTNDHKNGMSAFRWLRDNATGLFVIHTSTDMETNALILAVYTQYEYDAMMFVLSWDAINDF